MNPKLILSLTTYPKRFEYLNQTLKSILSQSIYSKVDIFYINIDDNLDQIDYQKYNELLKLDNKIRIKICESRWKSANKLLWVYKDHPNDVIVCFDDDKNYPVKCLEQVYNTWIEHPNCIVAQEINPIIRRQNGDIDYLNTIDVMLNQIEYGKYLSNGCLFCPNAFSDLLYDYDTMMSLTDGKHDELWFWIVSTIKGTPCIGLDYTYSWCLDENVCLDKTDGDLTNINCKPEVIASYNRRINEKYNKELSNTILNNPTKFYINHSNVLAIIGNLQHIYSLYGNMPVDFICDETIVKSWQTILTHYANNFKWYKLRIILDK